MTLLFTEGFDNESIFTIDTGVLAVSNDETVFTGLGGTLVEASVTATDTDNFSLVYSLGPGSPSFLSINPATGALGGTLPNPIGGLTYKFTVIVKAVAPKDT